MKRLLAILLVLLVVVMTFAACSVDNMTSGDTDNTNGNSSSESLSESESETELDTRVVEYVSKNVTIVDGQETPVELPQVPLLPNGELPSAE